VGLGFDGHIWKLDPSLNVLDSREKHPGEHETPSFWHDWVEIEGVVMADPWTTGA